MKKILSVLICLLPLFALITYSQAQTNDADSAVSLEADATGLSLVPVEDLPADGTFWLVTSPTNGLTGVTAPFPFVPPGQANGNIYVMANGVFLLDDTSGDAGASVPDILAQADAVSNLITQVQATTAAQAVQAMGFHAFAESGPPGITDSNVNGGGSGGVPHFFSPPFNTNLFWLQITNEADGLAYLNLNRGTDMVYAVWGTTNLLVPFTNWQVFAEVWPTNGTTNVLPFTVTASGDTLFLRAQDWRGVYINGLPAWWTWYYFHTLDLSSTDLDANGNTLGYDYTNHSDPNTIDFTIAVTNLYVNTASPSLPLDVTGGLPGYAAVLINDTNTNDAIWLPFNGSDVVAPLGADGNYTVSVGLRGFPTNATPSWETLPLTKDTVFPELTITNLTSGAVVQQTPIQFQGYASEPLDTLTYDLSNAAGTATNQEVNLTGVIYDLTQLAGTTNFFQSDAVNLVSGTNTITLHATDWAGNTTNVNFAIRFVPSTNPPVLTLFWPEAGAPIIDSQITLKAHVSDPTAAVTTTVDGTAVPALVAGDGSIWVQNLSVNPGNNTLTLTASTALGGTASTNFSVNVVTNRLGLTVNEPGLSGGSFFDSGSINDLTTNTVYVNGVEAVSWYQVTGGGWEWSVQGVPVNAYGMADAKADVYQGGSVLVASTSVAYAQPTAVVLKSYSGHQVLDFGGSESAYADNINWSFNTGGTVNDPFFGVLGVTPGTNGDAMIGNPAFDYLSFNPPWEYASVNANIPGDLTSSQSYINTRVMIEPSGIQPVGATNLYLVLASAFEASNTNFSDLPFASLANADYSGDIGLPPEWLEINGTPLANTGLTNTVYAEEPNNDFYLTQYSALWGATVVSAPATATPDVTPVATRVYKNRDYTFNVQAYQLHMQILDASGNDLTLHTNNVIVGQQMNLTCQVLFTNSFLTNYFVTTNFQWTIPGNTISNYVVADDQSSGIVYTNFPINNTNVTFFWVDGATNRIVQCSATVNGQMITGQATFDVIRPTINWNGQVTGPVALGTNYVLFPGVLSIHFGGTVINGTTNWGISCIATNANLNGYDTNSSAGFLAVQLINSDVITLTGTNHLPAVLTTNGLDNDYPVLNMGSGNGTVFYDGPALGFPTNLIQASKNESFRTVLMFIPDEPQVVIPVPIREVDWNWSANAIFTNGQWTLVSTNAAVTLTDHDTYTYPTWTNVVANKYY